MEGGRRPMGNRKVKQEEVEPEEWEETPKRKP